ncbi:TRAP transporter small permease subunit [Oricola thermophila]|uniref:TRAP transporter small permease protein n=1 Tax=Oricola thermophila TaxID=2742145 RepID=A0A6N1V8V4_9HYPH|nr:TRAP transporter small permease subunit [Oricola thermophila]QKV17384.1 TRAP transporter small permease subunit [Oricola thermophila]
MRQRILFLCSILDRFASAVCVLAASILVAAVLAIVVLRYGFGTGFIRLQELAGYAFAVLLIFAIPVCLARDGHVRVEILSEALGDRYLAWADRVALVLFLVPVFGLVVWAYWPELAYSWSIREGSVETGGLGGLFIVKTALPVAAALTIAQGIAAVLRPRRAGAAHSGQDAL